MSLRILLVPSVTKGNGSGHIVRCLSLARELGQGAAVFVPAAKAETSWSAAELSIAYSREMSGIGLVSSLREEGREQVGAEHGRAWDLVVLDRRSTSMEELAFWERFAPVLAIDEGGPARSAAHYLLDILPRPRGIASSRRRIEANASSLGFLDLPARRREPPTAFKKTLVTFGGEDPAGLSLSLARRLVAEALVAPSDLTIVTGALMRGAPPAGLEGVTVLGPVQELKEHLASYDLVLTQFGLTAFEAAWAGCGVILLNPSAYHRSLARSAGFPEIGVRRPDLRALRRFLRSPADTLARIAALAHEEPRSLANFLAGLEPAGAPACPACGSGERVTEYRDEGKTVFRCASCGLLYVTRFLPGRGNPYAESYFFEEYRRQYGLTYLEDWPKLLELARSRLAMVEELAARNGSSAGGLSILDIGCAYGPFLAAARERGHLVCGIDAAPEAAAYVRSELGIPAISGDFLDPAVAAAFGGPFDLVTMWFVVEHFTDMDRALGNAAALLKTGGMLAISTPSAEGASGRFARSSFFASSPADHFSIWEPSRIRGILQARGFRIEKIRITGHHPERLPLFRRVAGRAGRAGAAARAVGLFLSRVFRLGDTFELYAVKERGRAGSESPAAPAAVSNRGEDAPSEAAGLARGKTSRRGKASRRG